MVVGKFLLAWYYCVLALCSVLLTFSCGPFHRFFVDFQSWGSQNHPCSQPDEYSFIKPGNLFYHSHKMSVIQSFFLTESNIATLTAFSYVLSTHNLLWAELYSSSLNSHVEVLASTTSRYDCI